MNYIVHLPSLIVAGRLLCSLALLIGLVFSLGSLLPAQMTSFNLTCSDSSGLIQAINQAQYQQCGRHHYP